MQDWKTYIVSSAKRTTMVANIPNLSSLYAHSWEPVQWGSFLVYSVLSYYCTILLKIILHETHTDEKKQSNNYFLMTIEDQIQA